MKTKQNVAQEEDYKKSPHSFVFHRGHIGKNVLQLIKDMRQVMEPYTASKLQVQTKIIDVDKDLINVHQSLLECHLD